MREPRHDLRLTSEALQLPISNCLARVKNFDRQGIPKAVDAAPNRSHPSGADYLNKLVSTKRLSRLSSNDIVFT